MLSVLWIMKDMIVSIDIDIDEKSTACGRIALNILFSFLVILGTVEWKEYEICGCQNGNVIQLFSG